ncbi:oligopeptide/dipeptide ABC transporter ATP-binding protein [Sinorhizobium americanum]|uniref:oligopeptide/dipeptide ABC transporter ATP-binding protein n=1 Tax=Sinorhizobium americanum TaxID=194963 RepID=UPI0009EE2FD5
MRSVPDRRQGRQRRLPEIPGNVPRLREPIVGYSFAPRCLLAIDICREKAPDLGDVVQDNAVDSCVMMRLIEPTNDRVIAR